MRPSLALLFSPRSIAVIGASPHLDRIGGRPIRFLQEKHYGGRVYPVNPRCREVAGLPCHADVRDLPETPDVALILVRAARVPDVLEACAARGIPFAIVFAAGFAEAGEAGAALDARMREIVDSSDMRVVGPNCYGCLNVGDAIPLGFATPLELEAYPRGPIGFYSQSGAFGFGFLTMAAEAGLGFSYVLNSGNSVDVGLCDMLEFLAEDPDTRIVAAYVEEIRDVERFARAVRACLEKGKPVVALKVGHTEVAARAARAHTGSVTGSEAAFRRLAEELGVTVAGDPDALLDVLKGFAATITGDASSPLLPSGSGVAVLTTTGASGILFAEAAEKLGLCIPELDGEARERVAGALPPYAVATNPIDTTAAVLDRPRLVADVLGVLRDLPRFGSAVVMVSTPTGEWAEVLAEGIRSAADRFGRPVFVTVTSGEAYTADFRRMMEESGIPVFQSPHRAARALAALVGYADTVGKLRERP